MTERVRRKERLFDYVAIIIETAASEGQLKMKRHHFQDSDEHHMNAKRDQRVTSPFFPFNLFFQVSCSLLTYLLLSSTRQRTLDHISEAKPLLQWCKSVVSVNVRYTSLSCVILCASYHCCVCQFCVNRQ